MKKKSDNNKENHDVIALENWKRSSEIDVFCIIIVVKYNRTFLVLMFDDAPRVLNLHISLTIMRYMYIYITELNYFDYL